MTIKQKAAIKNTMENGGNVTQGMRDAEYAESTINNPSNLTKSKAWDELVGNNLPDSLVIQKLSEGLDANKQLAARVIFKKEAPTSQSAGELPLANSSTDDFIEVPDYAVRHKYVETALKVKGRLLNNLDITSGGDKMVGPIVYIPEEING